VNRRWTRLGYSLAAVLAVTIACAPLFGPWLQDGDAAVYNQQIEAHRFDIRTTHIGYIALGTVFHALSPLSTDTTMNVMTAILGAVGVVAVAWLALALGASPWLAVLAAALAFAGPEYLRGMVLSEVDIVLAVLAICALALYAWRRPVLAGAAYGLAMLCSPLGAWSLPWFVCLRTSTAGDARSRWRDHARQLATFGVVSLAVYAPIVVWHWHDYFYGGRGILHAPRRALNLLVDLGRSVHFFEAGLAIAPLMVAGLALVLTRRGSAPQRSLAIGVLISAIASALWGERFLDVPVQLPNWLVLACYAALVGQLVEAPRRWVAVPVAALLMTGAESAANAVTNLEQIARMQRDWLAMAQASVPHPIFLVGFRDVWNDGKRFNRVVYHRADIDRAVDWLRLYLVERESTGPAKVDVWLVRPVPQRMLRPMLKRYRIAYRTIDGRRREVLVPK
jgi:hypothetical protein